MTKTAPLPFQSHRTGRLGAVPITLGAILCATLLTAPAFAADAPVKAHHTTEVGSSHEESVEQRIIHLHAELKIKDDQEADWKAVAQVMRDNEAAMRKLAAETASLPGRTVTALDDLRNYERFSQAHVNGLKSLIGAFETLYNTMPDAQKANADTVFKKFGHHPHHAAS